MYAEELMIGDWVLCDMYNPCDPYYPPCTMGEFQMRPEDYTNGLAEEYKPIPLTPEILKKNGFKHNKMWHNSFKDIDNFSVDIQFGIGGKVDSVRIKENGKDNVIPSEKTSLYLTHIQYVHQLQHALRLSGINKKIKL